MADVESPGDILYYAAEGSLADMERLVKRHREWITHRDNRGRTAAMHAAIADNVRNLQFLMKKGLSLWDTDSNGATTLHWATQCSAAKGLIYESGLNSFSAPKFL
ncbi:hypothetical protein GCK32_019106 [Trichostrongylus colubriformis]|uniref:ANK_REP_REGION domain-containing protein n=1 Tax=Trichostrongylus colubriformis TaxID=6319 RepID=A0AAN8F443_TRICO